MDEIGGAMEDNLTFWTCEHIVNGVRKQPVGPLSKRQMHQYVLDHTRRIGEQVVTSEWRARRVRSWEQGL